MIDWFKDYGLIENVIMVEKRLNNYDIVLNFGYLDLFVYLKFW